jgi:hypothetical protein
VSKSFPFSSDFFLNLFENGRSEPLPCSLPQGDSVNPYSARSFADDPLYVGGVGRGSFRIAPKVWLLPQAVYQLTLIAIAFKQVRMFASLKKRICMLFENFLIK